MVRINSATETGTNRLEKCEPFLVSFKSKVTRTATNEKRGTLGILSSVYEPWMAK